MSKKLFIYFVLSLVLVIGSWFRLSGILDNSFAFTYDVGRDMLAVKSIVVDHKLTLIGQTTGVEGIFYGPWWYLFLSIPFFLFSGNPQGIAFFMGIIGVATILIGYIVGKKVGGVFLGIIFASLISFSPILISYSSQIWNPNPIPFLVALSLLILSVLASVVKPIHKSLYILLLGFLSGLIIDMEIVFGILFTLGIFTSLIIVFRKVLKIKELFFFILGLLFIFSPRILFEIRNDFLMSRKAISVFGSGLFSSEHASILDTFVNRLNSLFDVWNHSVGGQNNTVSFILITFVFLGLFLFYRKTDILQKQLIKVIFIVNGVFLIGLTLFSHDIWPHYLVGMPIFYISLLSLVINMTKTSIKKFWIIVLLLNFLFWINLNPVQVLTNIKKPVWEGNAAVYRNQVAVVDYIYSDAKGRNFKYIVYTPPVHDYTYRYLFSWYGKNKYGYTPLEINSKLFYLILEPDYDSPFRLRDWLKAREGDGIIQKEKIVKGGITVQTRIENYE